MSEELPGSRRPVDIGDRDKDATEAGPGPAERQTNGPEKRRGQAPRRTEADAWLDALDEGERAGDEDTDRPGADIPTRRRDDEAIPFDQSTHEHAPVSPVVIIGGGHIGRGLMRKFSQSVVLETDPTKIAKLREEFGANRVYHGSGANEEHLRMAGIADSTAVVAATNNDSANLKASIVAKDLGISKVIARLEDPELAPRFVAIGVEPVAAPRAVCVNMITNLLSPARRTISEGIIGQGAPTIGVRIRDLNLPGGAIIVSILRGDHLLSPDPEERLDVGDVVTVMSEKGEIGETLATVTGRDLALNPLDRLYVPILATSSLRTSFREAFVLAEYADAEIFLLAVEGMKEVVKEAERLCIQSGIPVISRMVPRKRFTQHVIDIIEEEDRSEEHGGLAGHLFFECVVIEPESGGLFDRLLRRRMTDRLLRKLDHPLIISRNLKPYKNILLVIDNTVRASMLVAHTIDLALVYGSDVTALMPERASSEESYRLLRHLKRTGRIYGVEVTERAVVGNPTLEYIREVKSGDFDLIVVDWQGRSVKRDILRKVIGYGPRSNLVLP